MTTLDDVRNALRACLERFLSLGAKKQERALKLASLYVESTDDEERDEILATLGEVLFRKQADLTAEPLDDKNDSTEAEPAADEPAADEPSAEQLREWASTLGGVSRPSPRHSVGMGCDLTEHEYETAQEVAAYLRRQAEKAERGE